jgi:hypothetical protein
MDSTYNCLLLKNVHNSSGGGKYVFSGLVSGKVLLPYKNYFWSGGNFGMDELPAIGYEGFQFLQSTLIQGMRAFDPENLGIFESISNPISNIYAGDNVVADYISSGTINFNNQSFVAHTALLPNSVQYDGHNILGGGVRVPTSRQVVLMDFTGILPTPITGYIQRGAFRHYLNSGTYSGFFVEEEQSQYANIPFDQDKKTNINSLYTHTFNGNDQDLVAKKYISTTATQTLNQVISPPYTGFLQSGYFIRTITSTGSSSGIFNNFTKHMPAVWGVSISDDETSGYVPINEVPYWDGVSSYRIENIPVVGDSEKYIKVDYEDAGYNNTNGDTDKARLSFSLSSYSGSSLIEE